MKRIFTLSIIACSFPVFGLPDPRDRDEDISATELSVTVAESSPGFFSYVYTLESPDSNKGTLSSFDIDIGCNETVGEVEFPEPPAPHRWDYATADRRHAAFLPFPSPTGSSWMLLSRKNQFFFLTNMEPGESHTGFRLLSPHPAILRPYKMEVSWKIGDYDYESLTDEEFAALPIRDDFYVYGMIEGPGCSTDATPSQLFPGTGEEPDDDLMAFEAPLRSAFHTTEDVVRFRIHYAKDIDPASFRVIPESAKGLFNPVPGGSEEVFFKLEDGINELTLIVERDIPVTEARKLVFKPFDRDFFVFRRGTKEALEAQQ